MRKKSNLILSDEAQTLLLGAQLASVCPQNCVIYINGSIGVGKSVFCKGFLYKLGHIGNVVSPTYSLMESYVLTDYCVYHFDFYRIHSFEELNFTGIRDYFNDRAIFLIEWPKQVVHLPKPDISLTICYDTCNLQARKVILESDNSIGKKMLSIIAR